MDDHLDAKDMSFDQPQTAPHMKRAAVIVAHPDDEVLWCGGLILTHREWSWHVVTLCRASDPDRAPRFRRVVEQLGISGTMGDMDDGPTQEPLECASVRDTIQRLLPDRSFDLIITHGPRGEYTRHRRHEEVCLAVTTLWKSAALTVGELWMFAFEDNGRRDLPRAISAAPRQLVLAEETWHRKHALMTDSYGFAVDSWEARATPRVEAFWTFADANEAAAWVNGQQEDWGG